MVKSGHALVVSLIMLSGVGWMACVSGCSPGYKPPKGPLANLRSGTIPSSDTLKVYEAFSQLPGVKIGNEARGYYGGILRGDDLVEAGRRFPQLGVVHATTETVLWFHGFEPSAVIADPDHDTLDVYGFDTRLELIHIVVVAAKDAAYTDDVLASYADPEHRRK